MKVILFVAGLLGVCNVAAADLVRDTFLTLRVENYFHNPLAFPEPGMDILAAPQPLAQLADQAVIESGGPVPVMRGGSWSDLQFQGEAREQPNSRQLWWLLATAGLVAGATVSAAGRLGNHRHRPRRRVKTIARKMASC